MKKVSWDDQGQVPWSLSYANTGNTYGFRRKCKTDDKIGRKNAARLLKENGLHFSLKSFFVKKNTVRYPIRKPQQRYFAGLSS